MKEKKFSIKGNFWIWNEQEKKWWWRTQKLVSRLSFFKTQLVYDANEAIMLWWCVITVRRRRKQRVCQPLLFSSCLSVKRMFLKLQKCLILILNSVFMASEIEKFILLSEFLCLIKLKGIFWISVLTFG